MRTITRFAAAILAAIGLSAPLLAAAPAASWSDFTNLTSGNYTLTADAACTVKDDGSITLGGAGLSYTFWSGDGMYANKFTTVVMDVTLPDAAGTLLTLGLATNKIQVNSTGSALTTSYDKGSVRQTGTCAAGRTTIAVTYSSSQGTHVYKDGVLIITDRGLMWSGQNLNKLTIGACNDGTIPLTGTILHSMTIYAAKLSAEEVLSETAAAVKRTAEVSGAATWSGLTWVPSAPTTSSDSAVLQVAEGKHTLTLDNGEAISLSRLFTQGMGSLTFDGSGSLASTATTIATDTDVSAITANLGAVTVAADKTLTTGPNTTMTGLTFGSASAAVKVTGLTPRSEIPYGILSKTGTVEIEPTINLSGDDAKLSFNTTQTLTYSADVNAPRLVVGDSGSANATITQVGGTITLSSSATACNDTNTSAILLGHWNTTTTYNLQAGTLSAPNGALCLGWDGTTTLNVGAATGKAALVNVYALKSGDRYREAAVTVNPTGTLQVGAGGIGLGSHSAKSVTLAGGTLLATATASANIAHANGLNVTAPSTIAAAPSAMLTINKVSGAGNLTIGTAEKTGSVVISDLSAYTGTATASIGTLDLGTQRPTLGGIADGATVKLTATDAELANGAITFSTTMGTAPAKERFTVVKPDGTTVLTLTAEPTITDGTLTVPLPHTGGVITATGNWSEAGVSEESVVYVRGSENAAEPTTVTLDADLSGYTHIGVIGHVKFVTTTTQATLPATIALERGSVLTATASFSGTYTIPSGATVVLDGTTTAISSGNALTVNGTLKTQGTVTLSGANRVPAGGTLTVETGTLTLTANGQGLAGTVNIAAGATLVNVTGDALAYGGTPVVNVRGTLDMGETRWTVGNRNTLNVYAGATIKGVGDQHGALDFYNNGTHTLNVPDEGDASQPVTISAKLRLRQANVLLKFNIALANAKVNLTGIVRDVGSLEKAGSGSSHLVLSGENKVYTGATTVTTGYLDLVGNCTLATSGVTVASGAAVTFQADESTTETPYTTPFALTGRMDKEGAHSVILSGAITGAGAVNVKNGGLTLDASAATAESPTAVANPITVGLDSGNAGTLTTKGYLTLSSNFNTVKPTGTLNIASDTTVLTTAGCGIKGKLAIASNATLQCGKGDAPDYDGSPSFEIAGTLEITDSARWSIPSTATVTLHEGARLKGTGPASGYNYAFDFFNGGTITADGDATIEATLGDHIGGQTLTITQSAGTTTITGEVRNGLTLKAAGSGTVAYAPAAGVTATTSPLVVDTGATLQLLPKAAFTLNGTVTGAGKLVIGDGSAATAVKLNGTLGTVTGTGESAKATHSSPIQIDSGSTLIFNSATPTVLTNAAISGAGSLTIAGSSSFTFGEGSNSSYSGATLVESGATLVLNCDINNDVGVLTAVTADTAAVTVNGTLKGLKGTFYRQVKGSGLIQVPSAGALTIGRDISGVTGIVAGFTGTIEVASEGTLSLPSWGGTHAVANCNITNDGKIEGGGGNNGTTTVTISNEKTLKGSGEILPNVTFKSGSSLDVSAGAPTLSVVSGTVTVTGYTKAVQPVLKTASEVTFAAIDGYTLPKSGESYWLVKDTAKTLSAVATEDATWSALPWKSSDNMAVSSDIFMLGLDLTANVSASDSAVSTPYIGLDVEHLDFSKTALTLSGSTLFVLYEEGNTTPANFKSLTVTGVAAVEILALNNVHGTVTVDTTGALYPIDSKYIFTGITESTTLTKAITGTGVIGVMGGSELTMSSTLGTVTDGVATFEGSLSVGAKATLRMTSTTQQKVLGDIACADSTSALVIGNGSQASRLVLKGHFRTGQTDSTFGGTLAISQNSYFTFASTSATTVTGAVVAGTSGTGRLTLGDGTTESVFTVTGTMGNEQAPRMDESAARCIYNGAIEVANRSTLTVAPAMQTLLSQAVSGTGKLVIGNGTDAQTVGLSAENTVSTVEVKPQATLELSAGNASVLILPAASTVTVAEGATLELSVGKLAATVSGEGEVSVPTGGDFTYLYPADATNVLGAAKVEVAPNATLTLAAERNAVTLGVDLLVVNGSLNGTSVEGLTSTPKVSLMADQALGGKGQIHMPVELAENAILDGTHAMPGEALRLETVSLSSVKVKANNLCRLFSCPSSESTKAWQVKNFTLQAGAPADAKVVIRENTSTTTTFVGVSIPPTMPADNANLPAAIAGNSEIMAAIQEKAEAWLEYAPISEITSVSAKNSAGGAVSADGATLFTGLEVTVAVTPGEMKDNGTYKGTATVTYDFGVSDITVKSANLTGSAQLYVVVCAKVSNATGNETNTADYANDTTVSLLLDGATPVGVVSLTAAADFTALGLKQKVGERWFAVPLGNLKKVTNAFTVRASKNTPPTP